jgi:DNA-binding transcriptional LysR family regulator
MFIAPVVTGFLSQYPEVSVDLRDGDAMIDLIHERFDLAIMPVSPPDSTLVRRTLAKWRYVLCCAPAYLKKHPEPCSPADLAGHNCLLYAYAPFSDQWPFLDARGNTVIARVSATLVTTSITVLRRAAIGGLGLWLSPPFVVSDLLASKELVSLLPDYRLPEMEIVALYPHRRHLAGNPCQLDHLEHCQPLLSSTQKSILTAPSAETSANCCLFWIISGDGIGADIGNAFY